MPEYRELYKQWKETIERIFADEKDKYVMRYTPYRDTDWVRLKFFGMNLKKYAVHKWKRLQPSTAFTYFYLFLSMLIF